jgi:cytoskeletal protein CcmA (bactofilin family)
LFEHSDSAAIGSELNNQYSPWVAGASFYSAVGLSRSSLGHASQQMNKGDTAKMETRLLNKNSLMVGEGVLLEGKVTTSGNVDIRGVLRGEVTAESVHVWDTGAIEGSVFAKSMIVEGQVGSNVNIAGELAIRSSGMVGGSISYQKIEIEKGAVVRGKLSCTLPDLATESVQQAEHSALLLPAGIDPLPDEEAAAS